MSTKKIKRRSLSQKQKPLSWKPKRIGETYCAPACGGDCTFEMFQTATKKADSLCAILSAGSMKGWTPRVWENLGWHYSVISPCGRIKVHPSYTAFLGDPKCSEGMWAESANTPFGAVKAVIAAAKRELKKIDAILKGL